MKIITIILILCLYLPRIFTSHDKRNEQKSGSSHRKHSRYASSRAADPNSTIMSRMKKSSNVSYANNKRNSLTPEVLSQNNDTIRYDEIFKKTNNTEDSPNSNNREIASVHSLGELLSIEYNEKYKDNTSRVVLNPFNLGVQMPEGDSTSESTSSSSDNNIIDMINNKSKESFGNKASSSRMSLELSRSVSNNMSQVSATSVSPNSKPGRDNIKTSISPKDTNIEGLQNRKQNKEIIITSIASKDKIEGLQNKEIKTSIIPKDKNIEGLKSKEIITSIAPKDKNIEGLQNKEIITSIAPKDKNIEGLQNKEIKTSIVPKDKNIEGLQNTKPYKDIQASSVQATQQMDEKITTENRWINNYDLKTDSNYLKQKNKKQNTPPKPTTQNVEKTNFGPPKMGETILPTRYYNPDKTTTTKSWGHHILDSPRGSSFRPPKIPCKSQTSSPLNLQAPTAINKPEMMTPVKEKIKNFEELQIVPFKPGKEIEGKTNLLQRSMSLRKPSPKKAEIILSGSHSNFEPGESPASQKSKKKLLQKFSETFKPIRSHSDPICDHKKSNLEDVGTRIRSKSGPICGSIYQNELEKRKEEELDDLFKNIMNDKSKQLEETGGKENFPKSEDGALVLWQRRKISDMSAISGKIPKSGDSNEKDNHQSSCDYTKLFSQSPMKDSSPETENFDTANWPNKYKEIDENIKFAKMAQNRITPMVERNDIYKMKKEFDNDPKNLMLQEILRTGKYRSGETPPKIEFQENFIKEARKVFKRNPEDFFTQAKKIKSLNVKAFFSVICRELKGLQMLRKKALTPLEVDLVFWMAELFFKTRIVKINNLRPFYDRN